DFLILDDIDHVRQSPEKAEVLFSILAERYERRSILMTSNVFARSRYGKSSRRATAVVALVARVKELLAQRRGPKRRGLAAPGSCRPRSRAARDLACPSMERSGT